MEEYAPDHLRQQFSGQLHKDSSEGCDKALTLGPTRGSLSYIRNRGRGVELQGEACVFKSSREFYCACAVKNPNWIFKEMIHTNWQRKKKKKNQ